MSIYALIFLIAVVCGFAYLGIKLYVKYFILPDVEAEQENLKKSWKLLAEQEEAYRKQLEAVMQNGSQEQSSQEDVSAESSNASESDRLSLEDRIEALGLEFSDVLQAEDVDFLDEETLPSCEYNDREDVLCCTCGQAEMRNVTASDSEQFEGFLGIYCFCCGNGKFKNHVAPPEGAAWNNLYNLVKDCEKSQQKVVDTAPVVDTPSE